MVIKIGAPKGCVLFPILCILYTNEWQASVSTYTFYYADEEANFIKWCCNNYLEVNATRTQEQ